MRSTSTTTIKDFLSINRFAESYNDIKHTAGEYNPLLEKKTIDLSIQSQYTIKRAQEDINNILEAEKNFNKRTGPRIGDYINLPDGQQTTITHIWEDGQIQTGNRGSCHLTKSGYISRSGSLDTGLKAEDIQPTTETKKGLIWSWHQNLSGGGRGVYFNITFKVYKTVKGANLDGCPEVKELKRQKNIAKSETITRINGNGQEYTLPMPEIHIINPPQELEKKFIKGAKFVICGINFFTNPLGNGQGQPMAKDQINKLLKRYKFSGTYYNNGSHHNTLFLRALKGPETQYLTLK